MTGRKERCCGCFKGFFSLGRTSAICKTERRNSSLVDFSDHWLVGGFKHFIFFHSVGNVIIPTDELIFLRGVGLNHQPVDCAQLDAAWSWSRSIHMMTTQRCRDFFPFSKGKGFSNAELELFYWMLKNMSFNGLVKKGKFTGNHGFLPSNIGLSG